MNFHDQFERDTVSLIMDEPMYGYLLFSQKLEVTDSVPTLAVDGRTLFINPGFYLSLDRDIRLSALVHEMLHLAYEHPWRRGDRDPRLFGLACDFEINPVLQQYRRPLGTGWMYDPKYIDWPVERIYDDLQQKLTSKQAANLPTFDEVRDCPGDTVERANAKAEAQVQVIKAAGIAKMFGKLPAGIERLVGNAKAKKIAWHEQLRRWLRSRAYDEYTWARTDSRAFLKTGVIAPKLYNERVRKMAVAIDWSGSMTDSILAEIQTHFNQLLSELRPRVVDVLHFDACIQSRESFGYHDLPIKFRTTGGGGTDFRPVFAALEDESPEFLVVFTDTYGTMPSAHPGYPVVWVTNSDRVSVPFGDVINM